MLKPLTSLLRWLPTALLLVLALAAPAARAQSWQQALAFNQLLDGNSVAQATAVNAAGDVFVTGYFAGQVSFGSTLLTSTGTNGYYDVFVAKWSPGSGLWQWAVSGGGNSGDYGRGIAVSGNSVYVTGSFINTSTNGEAVKFGSLTLNGTNSTYHQTDMFLVKYTDNGTSATCNWAVAGGGTGDDYGYGVAVNSPRVYVAGTLVNNTSNANGALVGGAALNGASPTVSPDALLACYTDAGSSASFNWATVGGGTGQDSFSGVAANGSALYLTGYLSNSSSNSGAVTFGGTAVPGASTNYTFDVLVAHYSDAATFNGVIFNWATAGGGTGDDRGYGVAVSGSGVYVTGQFSNDTGNGSNVKFGGLPLAGLAPSGGYDVFATKYTDNNSSAAANWAVAAGGTSFDQGNAIAVSGTGVYLTGYVTNNAANSRAVKFGPIAVSGVSPNDTRDVFVARYTDATTTANASWVAKGGGNDNETGNGLAVNGNGVYTALGLGLGMSTFGSTVVPERTAALGMVAANTGAWQTAVAPRPGGKSVVQATVANAAGDVFVTGSFRGQVTFGSTVLNSRGIDDLFLAKWNTAGGTWAWVVSGGGLYTDQGYGLALSGNSVYVTGHFENTPDNLRVAQFGGVTLAGNDFTGYGDLFVAKYTDNGTSATYNWAVGGGGIDADEGRAIAVSGTGVYVTGSFTNNSSNSKGVKFGGVTLAGTDSWAGTDVVTAKYTDNGTSATYNWAVAGGGGSSDAGNGLAVSGGSLYVAGSFVNNAANTETVHFGSLTLNGVSSTISSDVFVLKYTDGATAPTPVWAVAGGGSGPDYGLALAMGGTGLFVTGSVSNNSSNANGVQFGGTALPTQTSTVNPEVFVVKYGDLGSSAAFRWVTSAGGSGIDVGTALAVSGSKVYLTGYLTNDFNNVNSVRFGSAGCNGATSVVSADAFVARYSDQTTAATNDWFLVGGGSSTDQGNGVAVGSGKVFVGGLVTPVGIFSSIFLLAPTGNGVGLLASTPDGAGARPALATTVASAAGSALALYPNPAPGGAATLTGAAPGQAVRVLDALGRQVATATADATGTAALGGLAPGLYLVRVGDGSLRLAVE